VLAALATGAGQRVGEGSESMISPYETGGARVAVISYLPIGRNQFQGA
jgi:hypothetical protein